jgi:hypothetical protein
MRVQEAPLVLKLHNPRPYDALFHIVVHWGSLPEDAKVHLAVGDTVQGGKNVSINTKELHREGLRLAGSDATRMFPATIDDGCNKPIPLNRFRIYTASPTKNKQSKMPETLIGSNRPALMAVKVVVPAKKRGEPPPQFDLVQMEGTRVIGGCTVIVRA